MKDQEILVQIGSNVAAIRKSQNLTQQDVANRCSTSQQHIGRIEKGKANISACVIHKLCRALNTTPNNLYFNTICDAGDSSEVLPHKLCEALVNLPQSRQNEIYSLAVAMRKSKKTK